MEGESKVKGKQSSHVGTEEMLDIAHHKLAILAIVFPCASQPMQFAIRNYISKQKVVILRLTNRKDQAYIWFLNS